LRVEHRADRAVADLERRRVSLDDDLFGVGAALEDERDLAARGRVDRDALDDLGLESVADGRQRVRACRQPDQPDRASSTVVPTRSRPVS
jgi:hypothetical protein